MKVELWENGRERGREREREMTEIAKNDIRYRHSSNDKCILISNHSRFFHLFFKQLEKAENNINDSAIFFVSMRRKIF